MQRGEISKVDTVADGEWPVDPDLLPARDAPARRVDEERGAVIVSQPAHSRRAVGLALLAVLVIVLLAAALLWALSRRQTGTPAAAPASAPPAARNAAPVRPVPSVVGRTLVDAKLLLTARKMPVEVRSTPSRQPSNLVLAQSPGAGARLGQGDKVLLVVAGPSGPASSARTSPSRGAKQATVPTVTGLSETSARSALERVQLKVVEAKVPSAKPSGTVLRETPSAGSHVARGSIVRLELAVGPPKVMMPHVVGLSLGAATSQLRARGLRSEIEKVTSSKTAGTVLGQTPVSGAQLRRGMTVTLRVAAASAQVDVPDVTGLDADSARQQLIGAGFSVQVDNQPVTDPSQDGVVIDESPGGSSRAAKGSTVTITIGQAATQ